MSPRSGNPNLRGWRNTESQLACWQRRNVSATTVAVLEAASQIVGGNRALAENLGVSELLLGKFLTNCRELPDVLLLRAVDIILADRQASAAKGERVFSASQSVRTS